MAVFRVERNTGYTVMSNHHLRNKELSLKAKGLLSQMLSLPPCDISGFFKLPNGGTDSVDTFPVDVGQPRKGIIPILRQGQHLR